LFPGPGLTLGAIGDQKKLSRDSHLKKVKSQQLMSEDKSAKKVGGDTMP